MATAEILEAKSQEDCTYRDIKICHKVCKPDCPHYYSTKENIPEQEIIRRYYRFIKGPDYNSQ